MKLLAIGVYDIMVIAGPVFSAGITWLIARKKNDAETRKTNAETEHLDLENIEKHYELYRKLLDDFSTQVTQLRLEISELHDQNAQLKKQVVEFVKENSALKIEIELLTRKVNELERLLSLSK